MRNKSKIPFFAYTVFLLIITALSLITESCADNPSSLGKKFINPSETLGVKVFDSYTDTMQITSSNLRFYINTSTSINLAVGKFANYRSLGLIKFDSVNMFYDTATVSSAVLKLKYKNYYFPNSYSDSLGNIGFDIFTVQQNFNYSTVTYDSVNSNSFGNISQGSYTGSPAHDTMEVDIPLNNTLVSNWLKYRHDTSYSVKNYGVVLMPNAGSRVIKSFYSSQSSSYKPVLQITFSSNHDTILCNQPETVFLATTSIYNTPGIFKLLGGIGYVDVMKFDISKFSSKAIINDAQVILTLDPGSSVISTFTNQTVSAYYVTDTLHNTEGVRLDGGISNNQFSIRLISPFQRWVQGQANYGLMFKAYNNSQYLDLFSIFDVNSTDPLKRPRVIIKYTQRVP